MADYTLLDLIPAFAEHEHGSGWGHLLGGAHPVLKPENAITMTHVVLALVALVVITVLALIARAKYANKETAVIPEGKLSVRNFFEGIFDALFNTMSSMMGDDNAKRYFPLIASLAVFILISNLMGLVPGLVPPTQNLNTNVAMALVVFVFYNVVGIREQGFVNYMKHFAGPVWWLAFLMFPLELVSHAIRPLSLTLRLGGNMTGDHTVLGVFGQLASDLFFGWPVLLPVPFLFLGLLVSVVQTVVFCLLSAIYIAMAVEHHDHGDHHDAEHAAHH